jgi:cold shock CspA family protein
MRFQGKIADWIDDKGFVFITPNGGGNQVFIHIKSFSNRQGRPVGNEIVTYERWTFSKSRRISWGAGDAADWTHDKIAGEQPAVQTSVEASQLAKTVDQMHK